MPPGSTSVPLDLPAQNEKYYNYIHVVGGTEYPYVCEHNFCYKLPRIGNENEGSTIKLLRDTLVIRDTLLLQRNRVQAFACQLNPNAIGYETACLEEAFPKAKLMITGVFDGLKIAAALPPDMKWFRDCVEYENFLCTPLLCLNMDLAHSIEIVPYGKPKEKKS